MGDDESVGGGVQVGNINVDLLVLQSGHGADLGHEEDDVAHVDVVAQTVEDEEEVGPILSGMIDKWSRNGFFLLFLFFGLLDFLWFLLFSFDWSLTAFLAFNCSSFSFQSFGFFFNLLRFFLFSPGSLFNR